MPYFRHHPDDEPFFSDYDHDDEGGPYPILAVEYYDDSTSAYQWRNLWRDDDGDYTRRSPLLFTYRRVPRGWGESHYDERPLMEDGQPYPIRAVQLSGRPPGDPVSVDRYIDENGEYTRTFPLPDPPEGGECMTIRPTYYTEADPVSRRLDTHYYPLEAGGGWWPSPAARRIYRDAWVRAASWGRPNYGDEWGDDSGDILGVIDILGDIAAITGLPSGLAARDALCAYYLYDNGWIVGETTLERITEQSVPRRVCRQLGWPEDSLDFPDTTYFVDDASNYIPPMMLELPCRCQRPHCERCYPDGPPDSCRCTICRPPEVDDLGDDDVWEGLALMPDPSRGRSRFGIEVEFNGGDRYNIMAAIQRAGISCIDNGYTHEVVRYWKMTTDATVTGGELVSPVMPGDDNSIEQVREVIRLVKHCGGLTGRNVGMHVHLDVTHLAERQLMTLATNLRYMQNFLAAYVPNHRYLGGLSCGAELLADYEWDQITGWLPTVSPDYRERTRTNREASSPVSRYRAFNFNSLMTYGTIEVRLLGHTLNTLKVRTWIRVLQTIVEASRRRVVIEPDTDGLEWLLQYGLEQENADRYISIVEQRGTTSMLAIA